MPYLRPFLAERAISTDASITLHYATYYLHSWFDAIAPYHATAVGICTQIPRRPVSEHTRANRNRAILYASHKILDAQLPEFGTAWDQMLRNVGLDPNDDSVDLTTPVGIGNIAGDCVATRHRNDGMNGQGNEVNQALTERTDQGRPY